MPSPEKKERNKRLVKLRSKYPDKWTFEALGEEFNIKRPTAYKIYKRYTQDMPVDKVLTST